MKDLWEDLEPGSEVVKPPTVAEQLGHWEAPSSAALKRCPCHAAPWGGGVGVAGSGRCIYLEECRPHAGP